MLTFLVLLYAAPFHDGCDDQPRFFNDQSEALIRAELAAHMPDIKTYMEAVMASPNRYLYSQKQYKHEASPELLALEAEMRDFLRRLGAVSGAHTVRLGFRNWAMVTAYTRHGNADLQPFTDYAENIVSHDLWGFKLWGVSPAMKHTAAYYDTYDIPLVPDDQYYGWVRLVFCRR